LISQLLTDVDPDTRMQRANWRNVNIKAESEA